MGEVCRPALRPGRAEGPNGLAPKGRAELRSLRMRRDPPGVRIEEAAGLAAVAFY